MRFARHSRVFLSASFLASVLFCCGLPLLAIDQDNRPAIRFVRNPDPAPEFKLTGLDGKPVILADFRGKVILLNFWATWCGPCRAEIPDLVELQDKYKERMQIIGLAVDDDDREAVQKFVTHYGVNYPVAFANDEIRTVYGGIPALPTSFLLDTEGRVVQKHEGLRDPLLYETEIRALLGMSIGNVRVDTFEDTGQIFLKHAYRASELPGVDLSKLSAEQRIAALHQFNAEMCTCGCQYTLAQCRIYDHNCNVSKAAAGKIIAKLSSASPQPANSVPVRPPAPSSAPAGPQKPAPGEHPTN